MIISDEIDDANQNKAECLILKFLQPVIDN
jgi:hypothetical protein